MSDASRHVLYFVEEEEYGVTPETPSWTRFRHTEASPGITKGTNVSNELRPDRQIADFRHGTRQVGGDFGFELSYGSFDALLQAALLGTWAPKAAIETEITINADDADDSFNDSALGFVAAGFEVGDLVTVSGFTTGANNGEFKVSAVTTGKLSVTAPDGTPADLVDELAGDSVSIISKRQILKAGVERRSFSILRHFTDIQSADKPFQLFKGVEFNNLTLNLNPGEMVTGSFSTLGKDGELLTAAPSGSTLGSPTTTKVFDTFTGSLLEGGAEIGIVTEMSQTLENGLEPRFVLFSSTTIQPSIGRSNLTGQITVFFENSTMLEKFLDETPSSLKANMTDEDGNKYTFHLPNIKYTGGQPDTSGQATITLAMPFQAIMDSGLLSQIVIEREPA